MQQTWAYAKDSNHPGFFRYGKDQKAMYEDVVFSYDKAAQKQNISIVIPTGTAIQNGRSSSLGDTFCREEAAQQVTHQQAEDAQCDFHGFLSPFLYT